RAVAPGTCRGGKKRVSPRSLRWGGCRGVTGRSTRRQRRSSGAHGNAAFTGLADEPPNAWATMRKNARGGPMTEQPAAGTKASTASQPAAKMTPEAALARHIEWLEFALAAARSEETCRAGRLEKATKRNRDRRATRRGGGR